MPTESPPTFSPEIEIGLLVRAEELLGDDHDRDAALKLQEAAEHLEEAKKAKNLAVARLDEIALVYPTSTGPARKKLNTERLELAGELAFVPEDIAALGEMYVAALIPYATAVHHAAKATAKSLNHQLHPLEGNQIAARERREQVKGVDAGMAKALTRAGLPQDPADIGAGEEERANLGKRIGGLSDQIADLRGRRDEYADLAAAAKRTLTVKFGEPDGYGNEIFLGKGVEYWLDALRHRTVSHVARYTGGSNLKPIGG